MFKSYWFIGINPRDSNHFDVITTVDNLDDPLFDQWVRLFMFFGFGIYIYVGKGT